MNEDWKKDPRIQSMNPEKIEFLSKLTAEIQNTPQNQLLGKFLSLSMEASQRGISFSNQETELMTGILMNYMNPADKGRINLMRTLSQKLASRRS
ncbi:MAG: hypothetical protein HFG66_04255 [Hungatella sp.]|jgi:hypothetical protein|nr:hypothetical protein [Hungatella sp.]